MSFQSAFISGNFAGSPSSLRITTDRANASTSPDSLIPLRIAHFRMKYVSQSGNKKANTTMAIAKKGPMFAQSNASAAAFIFENLSPVNVVGAAQSAAEGGPLAGFAAARREALPDGNHGDNLSERQL